MTIALVRSAPVRRAEEGECAPKELSDEPIEEPPDTKLAPSGCTAFWTGVNS